LIPLGWAWGPESPWQQTAHAAKSHHRQHFCFGQVHAFTERIALLQYREQSVRDGLDDRYLDGQSPVGYACRKARAVLQQVVGARRERPQTVFQGRSGMIVRESFDADTPRRQRI
jgi:hypothetical protein